MWNGLYNLYAYATGILLRISLDFQILNVVFVSGVLDVLE